MHWGVLISSIVKTGSALSEISEWTSALSIFWPLAFTVQAVMTQVTMTNNKNRKYEILNKRQRNDYLPGLVHVLMNAFR